jgi:hypothetical protein
VSKHARSRQAASYRLGVARPHKLHKLDKLLEGDLAVGVQIHLGDGLAHALIAVILPESLQHLAQLGRVDLTCA